MVFYQFILQFEKAHKCNTLENFKKELHHVNLVFENHFFEKPMVTV